MEQPIVNLRGEKVALGPLVRENLPTLQRWMNDFDVTRTLAFGTKPVTLEYEQKWFETVPGREDSVLFHIYELLAYGLVGNCGFHEIDHQHGTCELGIVIGEKARWGKGLATETCRLLLGYAFGELGLHNVMLRAYAGNPGALKAYTRAGFRELGKRRESHRSGQKRVDIVYFDALASEWK